MIHSGTLFRAELFEDNTYPYTDVAAVYKANVGRYPNKNLIVTNGHWCNGVKPVGNYKVNGAVLSKEWDAAIGFAWSGENKPVMCWGETGEDNFISTIPAIMGGKLLDTSGQTAGVKRSCTRTWWGFDSEDRCYIEVTTAPYTLDEIKDRMLNLDIIDGLVLDGSGSSQWYDGETRVTGDGRRIYEYLLLWFDGECGENDGGKDSSAEPQNDKDDKDDKDDKEVIDTGKIVCIDPGHGGDDTANGSPDKRYKEHEFTLALALKIKPLLEASGIAVLMTRSTNVSKSLSERAAVANNGNADCYLAIHSNAAGTASCDSEGWCAGASGLCAFTSGAGATAGRNIFANKLLTRFKAANVNIHGVGLYNASFGVLVKTAMPAVLVEYLFHTNKADVEKLLDESFRDVLAVATAKAVCDYLGVEYLGGEAENAEDGDTEDDDAEDDADTDAIAAAAARLIEKGWGDVLIAMAGKI